MGKNKRDSRRSNSTRRNKLRKRVAELGLPCHICGKPIDYSLPARVKTPAGYVYNDDAYELDELVPISRYYLGGYETPEEAALDPDNVAPAHRRCNRLRSNKSMKDLKNPKYKKKNAAHVENSRRW